MLVCPTTAVRVVACCQDTVETIPTCTTGALFLIYRWIEGQHSARSFLQEKNTTWTRAYKNYAKLLSVKIAVFSYISGVS